MTQPRVHPPARSVDGPCSLPVCPSGSRALVATAHFWRPPMSSTQNLPPSAHPERKSSHHLFTFPVYRPVHFFFLSLPLTIHIIPPLIPRACCHLVTNPARSVSSQIVVLLASTQRTQTLSLSLQNNVANSKHRLSSRAAPRPPRSNRTTAATTPRSIRACPEPT